MWIAISALSPPRSAVGITAVLHTWTADGQTFPLCPAKIGADAPAHYRAPGDPPMNV